VRELGKVVGSVLREEGRLVVRLVTAVVFVEYV
jgi:hypothetical protein